jgi:peptidoglycan pentaglycine glycine transferase (the first glycine)
MTSQRYSLREVPASQHAEWDQFVTHHPHGHLLQSWGWGELKAGVGWRPLRLALWDEHAEEIVGAAQVLCRGAAHLPLRVGHLAYIPRGPVIDWSRPSLWQHFFAYLNPLLRSNGALALRLELARPLEVAAADGMMDCFSSTSFFPAPAIQPVRTVLLDLSADEEILLARMKEKWRYNLRLAVRKGVRLRVAQGDEDVRAWYDLMRVTATRDHFGIHTLDYYLRAWHIFSPRRQACLLLAEFEGELLAGIFVGLYARQGIYLYGASGNERRNLMPNYLLQWEAIRWARRQGATQYDLWGIPTSDDEAAHMAGVNHFKRGWGGKVVRFVGCYQHTYHPLAMQLAHKYIAAYAGEGATQSAPATYMKQRHL